MYYSTKYILQIKNIDYLFIFREYITMRSNPRSRRDKRSRPVNVMFSRAVGVCTIGNKGSYKICQKKTNTKGKILRMQIRR